jgi:hypothetical protein
VRQADVDSAYLFGNIRGARRASLPAAARVGFGGVEQCRGLSHGAFSGRFRFFPLPAAEMRTAIDVQDVPSNRRGVVQVHDCIRDVLDRRRLTHGRQALHHVPWGIAVKRRVNDAGRDGVYPDAVFRVLHREVLGDRLKTAFGNHRHRCRDAPDRIASKGRRDGDDAPAGLLRQHLLDGKLGDIEEALDVRRDERLEILGRVVRERLGEEDARVIDQRVNRMEARQRGLDNSGCSCRLADVAVHQGDLIGSDDLSGLGHPSGIGNDVETAFDKRFHNSRADPLRSSGHDGCLPWAAHDCLPEKVLSRR